MHSQQVVDMELSKTSFDVDLDEVDTDIPWLKSVPSADHRLKKKPGQSAHICDICQKSFKRKYNLIVHLRVHTGEKPFVCDICAERFKHKRSLHKHKLIQDCSQRFSSMKKIASTVLKAKQNKTKKTNSISNPAFKLPLHLYQLLLKGNKDFAKDHQEKLDK